MAFPQLIFMAIVALVIPKLEDFFNFKKLDIWTGEIPKWFARVFYGGIQRFALFWHNYEIHGIDNIRRDNCLLVGYHSRCTVDAVYATAFLEPTTIMSPIFFAVPGSKALFESINCVSSHGESKNSADSFIATVVRGGRPVMLFPGGHHECYKRLGDKHCIKWKELPGYARKLFDEPDRPGSSTHVVPFYTHNCESIYYASDHWFDSSGLWVIGSFRDFENGNKLLLPFLLPLSLMGLGNVVLPMPVKLDLYIGEPVIPRSKESAVEFAKRVNLATQALMDSVREKHSNDKNIHSVREMFVRYPAYVMYTIIQNVTMWSTVVFLNVLLVPIILFIQLLFRAFLTTTRGKSHDDENNEKKHN